MQDVVACSELKSDAAQNYPMPATTLVDKFGLQIYVNNGRRDD